MELDKIFIINRRIEIFISTKNGSEVRYRSRIEDIHDDDMVIAMPMSKGIPVMLSCGEVFWGRIIANSTAYGFTSSLISRHLWPIPVWTIALPYNLKKIQLRAFVRINATFPVQVAEIVDGKIAEEAMTEAVTKDISGNGLQLVSNRAWPSGTKLMVTVDYPDFGPITHSSEVVRVQPPEPGKEFYMLGIKFLTISKKDRSKIIKLIFKTQLELRRKGLA